MNTRQLLDRLEEQGVRNIDISRVLGLAETRTSDLRNGKRRLLYDEGVKLIEAFGLQGPRQSDDPLPIPVARLAVLHIVKALGQAVEDDHLSELAADLQALAALASEPEVKGALDGLELYLSGLRLRRSMPSEARQQLRPATTR